MPAAPAPFTTKRQSSIFLPNNLRAFMMAAMEMIAVPCWSSWKTGMPMRFFSVVSTSKQAGAAMSSRLMPPNVGSRHSVAAMTFAASVRPFSLNTLPRQIGTASISAKCLNSTALPSITGRPASGPMLPRPRTAVPSLTTATMLPRLVYSQTVSGLSLISRHGCATPGV